MSPPPELRPDERVPAFHPEALSVETRGLGVKDLVNLHPLMERTVGKPEIVIGLVDGPVMMQHPELASENLRELPGSISGTCGLAGSLACLHGTFVAGILCARRGSIAPAICPGCTLLVRPIFSETTTTGVTRPSATPQELAAAVLECVEAGARLVNLSAALSRVPTQKEERALQAALDRAANRGVIIVAASGNQGTMGSTAITRHPWVIAVTACDRDGNPLSGSNYGSSIGRRGLSAPGEGITSLGTSGDSIVAGGTSVAAPFVTGAIALAWSERTEAVGGELKLAVGAAHGRRRPSVVPALLNAWGIYAALQRNQVDVMN